MEKVLVLYSGGKDSLFSTILLLEEGYDVYLVHYDNSFELGCKNVKSGFLRLQKKYKDRVHYIGVRKTDGIFREFIRDFYNKNFKNIVDEFGDFNVSQFNCLACRVSMYIVSIIICKNMNIHYVADGARKSQLFIIEQDNMLNLFKKLFGEYDIELLLPVVDLDDDFLEKNELLVRGIIPKVFESQCLLGIPIDGSINNDMILSIENVYNRLIYPKISSIIERYSNALFGDEYL